MFFFVLYAIIPFDPFCFGSVFFDGHAVPLILSVLHSLVLLVCVFGKLLEVVWVSHGWQSNDSDGSTGG